MLTPALFDLADIAGRAAVLPTVPTPAALAVPPSEPARYHGSILEAHGEILLDLPCTLPCCYAVDEWDQPHVTLIVRPDGEDKAVRLERVRFQSFSRRP